MDGAISARQAVAALLLVVMALLQPAHVSAQDELASGPRALFIEYRTNPSDRPAFREYLVDTLAPYLRTLQTEGSISSFRVYYSWYVQSGLWDAMVELQFNEFEDVGRWNRLEITRPGGLDAKGLALGRPVRTISADIAHAAGQEPSDGAVFYMLPYEYENAGEYRAYLKGYVLPQFDGWRSGGALTGYEVAMNRYPVGAPWDSLAILEYRDLEAFGRRQTVLDSVRERLRNEPTWSDWHKRKGGVRSETENSIAELIAH